MQYKWVQLDLARQNENIPFIKQFMKVMADAGYNGILLYLEDRIRTASYPYPKDEDCYTPEQMADIVQFASTLGLEVVPCVEVLSHAERFLRHPEMQKFAEIQPGMTGRFGGSRQKDFCPTHPELFDFLAKYLEEVAAIFPSQFFHAGLDECWDYCLCDRCKKAAPDYAGEQQLFVDHVLKTHAILKGLGKRMLMWSDMFEFYPEALPLVPRDIIMVDWQYQSDVRFYLQHLLDCTVENRLKRNEELGFETFLGPVDMIFSNPRSYLEYAQGHKFIGCLTTSWEKTDTYLYRTFPTFVYAGHLMNGKPEEQAFQDMMLQLFGTNDAILGSAVRLALTNELWRHFQAFATNRLFSRDFRWLPYARQEADFAAKTMLQERLHLVVTPLGRTVLNDLIDALNEKCVAHKMVNFFHSVLDGHPADFSTYTKLRTALASHLFRLQGKWNILRNGIAHNVFAEKRQALLDQFDANYQTLISSKFVKIRLCLPDGYGVEHIRVSLQFEKDGTWQLVKDAVLKQLDLNVAVFEHFLPYQSDSKPIALKIEAYGLGGAGICYVEADGTQPSALLSTDGLVQNAENLLNNDLTFAWFGPQSTRKAYFDSTLGSAVSSVVLALR